MTAPGTNPGTDLATRPPLTGAGTVAGHPRWRRVFPGRDDQVREVRHWLAGLLPGGPERDDVVMVAAELATNAIRHTASGRGGFVTVQVTWHGPVVRVAVGDGGAPEGPRLVPGPAGLAECGRGLHLVRALAASTGLCGDHRGRVVWADVTWTGARPAETVAAPHPRVASFVS